MRSINCSSFGRSMKIFAFCFFSMTIAVLRSAHAQEVVRIAVGVDRCLPLGGLLRRRDFSRNTALNSKITQFSGGPDLADATMAGETDIASSAPPPGCRGSSAAL